MNKTLKGLGVSQGRVIGPVRRMGTDMLEPGSEQISADRAPHEQERARDAARTVASELTTRGARAGGQAQAVLEAQALIAQDPELTADVERRIDSGSSAARAVHDAFAAYREMLAGADDYFAGRVADLDDIRDRLVAHLLGVPMPGLPDGDEPYVLVARDLAPADTVLLNPALVLGFVTEEGGPTSHSAILARAMGVPAIVALPDAAHLAEGEVVAVDGSTGEVVVEPGAELRAAVAKATARQQAALAMSTGPGATRDGHPVPLLANIGGPADVPAALAAGAEGIGLFRTEFLFLDDDQAAPTQEKQADAYRTVLEAFGDARVVVRVLDAGADKPLAFLTPAHESNPALGVRGLRTLLDHSDVLHTQLSALAEAAAGLPVRLEVMAPMVADRTDTAAFAAACRRAGLTAKTGAMVEIPSAALRAHTILSEVEFLSLGTNDLAQYTFAADRQVGALSRLQDPWQPAVLDLVASAAGAARDAGRSCGVCGEAASDPLLACVLTGLGVTSLSMSPAAIPHVRAALSAHALGQCREAAAAARAADGPDQARTAASTVLQTS